MDRAHNSKLLCLDISNTHRYSCKAVSASGAGEGGRLSFGERNLDASWH